MNLIRKIITVLRDRPTYLIQYARGTLLFWSSRLIGKILIQKNRVHLGDNVRFQSIRNFLCSNETSKIIIGKDSVIHENARLESHDQGQISIGARSIVGDARIVSRYKITIGNRLLTSWNVLIQDFDPHPTSQNLRAQQLVDMTTSFTPNFSHNTPITKTAPLKWTPPGADIWIGDDVWIGANVTILKGTKIGHGSIVATGSVVTGGSFPDRSLIAGNPARLIKDLPE